MSTFRFPGFDRLFFLDWPTSMSRFHGKLIGTGGLRDFEITRGATVPNKMYASWAGGRSTPECSVHLLAVTTVLFDSRLFSAFEQYEVTGWLAHPIRLIGKMGQEILGYSLLVVTGRCGNVQYSRSERTYMSFPAGDSPSLKGLYFDEATWDGADVFMCESERQSVFVTEKARDAIQSITKDIKFPRLSDWEAAEFALIGATGFVPRIER